VPSPPRTNRRTALASLLGLTVALTACDLDPPRDSASPSSAAPDPEDTLLVAGMVESLTAASELVRAVVAATPALGEPLLPLAQAHDEHRAVLQAALPERTDADIAQPPAPTGRRAGLRSVRRSERLLLHSTREAALAARSGDLARVLASVAASTTQFLAVLDAGEVLR
jgi:hypothetical protein